MEGWIMFLVMTVAVIALFLAVILYLQGAGLALAFVFYVVVGVSILLAVLLWELVNDFFGKKHHTPPRAPQSTDDR